MEEKMGSVEVAVAVTNETHGLNCVNVRQMKCDERESNPYSLDLQLSA